MANEKIIEKIKKVLELSKNNPSEEEAKAAALQAQKLLAKYHIDMAEVEGIDTDKVEAIDEVQIHMGMGHKWKYELARVIANNFRCKHFYYGKGTVVFYGHKTDAEVAAATFEYLFKFGHSKAENTKIKVRKETGNGEGVYNAYIQGYLQGIKESLEKQCTALVLVVPQDVKDSYTERTAHMGQMKISAIQAGYNNHCMKARESGLQDGRSAMGNRAIEG